MFESGGQRNLSRALFRLKLLLDVEQPHWLFDGYTNLALKRVAGLVELR